MSDPSTPASAPAAPTAKEPSKREPASIVIRPWPKVVFLWPIFVVATIFWLMSWVYGTPTDGLLPEKLPWMGNVFTLVVFLNFLVFAFDFSRWTSLTIVFALFAVVAGLFWANSAFGEDVFSSLRGFLDMIDIQMNTAFYGWFSLMLGIILLLVLANTRFNYYEVNHREILHHHGFLGDVTRMPTTGLRLNKEIYDVMEFLLLRSGRLIFYPSTSREAIVIDNVLNVNHVENRIKDLLSVVAVRMTEAGHDDPM